MMLSFLTEYPSFFKTISQTAQISQQLRFAGVMKDSLGTDGVRTISMNLLVLS